MPRGESRHYMGRSRTRSRSRHGRRERSRSRHHDRKRSRSRNAREVPTPVRSDKRVVLTRRDDTDQHSDYGYGSKASGKSSRYGGSDGQPLKPLPRPGFDGDGRLEKLRDDPRYFEGAELGKAQKADLGIKGLGGMNTASFDKSSTLVRPAMRIIYGPSQKKRFGKKMVTDDVAAVPEFLCAENDISMYETLSGELKQLKADGCEDLSASPTCQLILKKMCRYLSISEDRQRVKLSWTRKAKKDGSERKAFELGQADISSSCGHNCTASVTLGSSREIAFWRSSAEDSIYFPQDNGMLLAFGIDVLTSDWKHGEREAKEAQDSITITVAGYSSEVSQDTKLGPRPVKKEAPPCNDFKWGRCSYGDKCRFSHGEKAQEAQDCAPFNPTTMQVRPSMRIITVPMAACGKYGKPVKHDDVIIVPDFFNEADGWDMYYQMIKEMRESQAQGTNKAEWISWHEGAHLLSQNPTGSPTYHKVLAKMREYFAVPEKDTGTRFNWYVDGSDWKPFHHDSAAFNPVRAKTQNCTIGVSFGCCRELGFRHAKSEQLVYFPQTNGMLFYFGQDTNIRWQHGVNALPQDEQDGKGRISVILWGNCTLAVDEPGSPPMLSDESRGVKGKGKGKGKGKKDGRFGFNMHSR
mmetsp:Transcript_117605/g.183739  ORF Transcript_117605/g.183739 Transcript_117605/m.183739 type:complete len:636 (+) Transcript_117605:32-1939(+)